MIRARLTALELAVPGGYSIDSDNDVNMRTAPPLPLTIGPPPQYAAEMAAVMLYKEMAPILTQVAQTALESHERVRQLEQQLQVLVIPQPAPLTVAFEEAMRSQGVSRVANLRNLRVAAQRSGVTKSRSQASKQSSRQNSPQPPPRAPSNVPTPPVVEPVILAPAIREGADRPYGVAASTPIPATPHNPAASASALVLPAPAKPSGRVGWLGLSDQPGQFASKYCNEGCNMVGGDGSEFYFSHRQPCVKGMDQAIIVALKEKQNVTPKNRCTYCQLTRHKVTNCGDFQRDYLRPQSQQSVRQLVPSRSLTHPPSDQMDDDELEEERFDGYDMPGEAQGGNTAGAGGGQPPRGGNVAGGDDPGDSSSSSSNSDGSNASALDLRDFLGSHKCHWS